MRLLSALLFPAAVAATVTVTPFCKNSVRVQITPSDVDADEDYKQQVALLATTLRDKELKELPGALIDSCGPGEPVTLAEAAPVKNGNIQVASTADGLTVIAVDTGKTLFTAKTTFSPTSHLVPPGFKAIDFSMTAGDKDERIYGLGQGNWTPEGGCPAAGKVGARIVPLERNSSSGSSS